MCSFVFSCSVFLFECAAQVIPSDAAIDGEIGRIMSRTHANGMAVAVVDHGKVSFVQAYGIRNAKGDPLTTDTVMYGASLTKTLFAHLVMQLIDQSSSIWILRSGHLSENHCQATARIPFFQISMDRIRIWRTVRDGNHAANVLTHSTGFSNSGS